MRRSISTVICFVWLLICLAISAAWFRSFYIHDYWPTLLHRDGAQLQSVNGDLLIVKITQSGTGQLFTRFQVGATWSRPPDSSAFQQQIALYQHKPGQRTLYNSTVVLAAPALSNVFGLRHQSCTIVFGSPGGNISIVVCHPVPYWIVVFVSTLPLGVIAFYRWRRSDRIAAGCCEMCGYDLRASARRCPECGTVIAAIV